MDRADKAHTPAGDGADGLLLLSVVANRFARGVDPTCQRRVRNNAAAPDRCDEVVLAHDAVSIRDQVEQQVEYLRLQSNQLGAASKLSSVGIKCMIFKEELHESALRGQGSAKAINQAGLNHKSSVSESHFAAPELQMA